MRMSAVGASGAIAGGTGVPGRHGCPGPRSAGVATRSSLDSRGTLVKRPVWYAPATAPDRDRHGEPGLAVQRGHGWRSISSASADRACSGAVMPQNPVTNISHKGTDPVFE